MFLKQQQQAMDYYTSLEYVQASGPTILLLCSE